VQAQEAAQQRRTRHARVPAWVVPPSVRERGFNKAPLPFWF